MPMILPIHVILSILFLQALRITSLPEEAFYGYPLQAEEDYVYLDSRADPNYSGVSAFKQSETRRRSILDKNFARFGRSGGYPSAKTKILALNTDQALNDDADVEPFGRNQRSGERSDQFIRFGRGKSDFVRFGRSDGGYQRNNGFIRFGRSTRSVKGGKTQKHTLHNPPNEMQANKVEKLENTAENAKNFKNKMADGASRDRKKRSPDLDFYKKGGSNFVRFGRDRNDNFMRFGRMMNQNHELNVEGPSGNAANPALLNFDSKAYNNTGNWKKYVELQGQDGHNLILKLLVDILAKTHIQNELQQLQQLQKNLQSVQGGKQLNQSQNVKENECRCN